jgi:hypothetical protein
MRHAELQRGHRPKNSDCNTMGTAPNALFCVAELSVRQARLADMLIDSSFWPPSAVTMGCLRR